MSNLLKDFSYTKNTARLIQERTKELMSFYSREDFAAARKRVLASSKYARAFPLADLREMCNTRGLDAGKLLKDEGILAEIPTKGMIREKLVSLLHDIYKSFPSPVHYMTRLVRRLAPEFQEDSVRVAILKKFFLGLGLRNTTFSLQPLVDWCKARLTEPEREAFPAMTEPEQVKLLASKLDDSLFQSFETRTTQDVLSSLETMEIMEKLLIRWQHDPAIALSDLVLEQETKELLSDFCRKHGLTVPESCSGLNLLKITLKGCRDGRITEAAQQSDEWNNVFQRVENAFRRQTMSVLQRRIKGRSAKDHLTAMQDLLRQWQEDPDILLPVPNLSQEEADDLARICKTHDTTPPEQMDLPFLAEWIREEYENQRLPRKAWSKIVDPILISSFERQAMGLFLEGRDVIYAQYNQAIKDARKKKQNELESRKLLQICDDLASAKFRTNGKTKLDLYYFALVFDMTVARRGEEPDQMRDVEKNLFHDYYTDNTLRFLEDAYRDPDLNWAIQYEKEPTGEGINYKNYLEAILLYFICKKDLKLTPGQRIDKAMEVTRQCISLARERKANKQVLPTDVSADWSDLTGQFQDLFDILLEKTPKELPDFIVSNYVVIPASDPGRAWITVRQEELTAFDNLQQIMDDLEKTLSLNEDKDPVTLEEMQYLQENSDGKKREKRWTDLAADPEEDERKWDILERMGQIEADRDQAFRSPLPALLRERYQSDNDFLRIVDAIEERLEDGVFWLRGRNRELMFAILSILCHIPNGKETISMHLLIGELDKKNIWDRDRRKITLAVKSLRKIGLNIRREKDTFSLIQQSYDDTALGNLIQRAKRDLRLNRETDAMLRNLLVKSRWPTLRITRTDLLAVHLNAYVYSTLETLDSGTQGCFPKLLEDYRGEADYYLSEARYQTISEKNILDVYVILSIYFYLMEKESLV